MYIYNILQIDREALPLTATPNKNKPGFRISGIWWQGDILHYVSTDHQYPSSQRNISTDVGKSEVPEE